ncbi:MAG: 13E12 repeat family protein [Candidatus Dormibacteraeota bacterium]|nr:13E12 repeat family protein [Candidatus Dormibacteraeota bacterium]
MAASASVVELRNNPTQVAARQLQAAVKMVMARAQEADGAGLGELLILIRESGIDPLEAAFATGVRRFDKSGEYAADGALSVTAWLKWRCKLSGGAAAERVEIGKQLERLPKTEEAFAHGQLGYQHVAVMARSAESLGAAAVRSEEGNPLEAAQSMDPGQFTTVVKNFEHRVDAAGALAETNRAYQRRYLHIGEPQGGVVRLDGLLDAEGGATVRAALAGLMKPSKDDTRTHGQRCADAFVELCRQGRGSKGDSSGPRPQLIIRASLDTRPASRALQRASSKAGERCRRKPCSATLATLPSYR